MKHDPWWVTVGLCLIPFILIIGVVIYLGLTY